MTRIEGSVFCDGCGAEITWAPYHLPAPPGKPGMQPHGEYCCADCAAGRPCACGERMELSDERRAQSQTPSILA
jgi:hypothetical protein